MMPKVVSFDCAETIIQLGWHPFYAMRDCASRAGVELKEGHSEAYGRLFLEWRPRYEEVNLTRDIAELKIFWDDLMVAWIRQTRQSELQLNSLRSVIDDMTYGRDNPWFKPFSDVDECLKRLEEMGIRTCVVSNWDLSLTRILESQNLAHRFELIVASLAEGIEKPNPGLFHVTLEKLGVAAHEVVHVGDNPIDDVEGANAAGIPALLIDRTLSASDPKSRTICSLHDLPEALTWNA